MRAHAAAGLGPFVVLLDEGGAAEVDDASRDGKISATPAPARRPARFNPGEPDPTMSISSPNPCRQRSGSRQALHTRTPVNANRSMRICRHRRVLSE